MANYKSFEVRKCWSEWYNVYTYQHFNNSINLDIEKYSDKK